MTIDTPPHPQGDRPNPAVLSGSGGNPTSAFGGHGAAVVLILGSIFLGGLAGWLAGPDAQWAGVRLLDAFGLLGTIFLNLLKTLVVPLIAGSIITSVANLGTGPGLGRLGASAFTFYVITTLIAMLIVLVIVNLVQPGIVECQPARELLALHATGADVSASVTNRASGGVLTVLTDLVPGNIVAAAAETQIIGLVLFCVLFGFFLARIAEPQRSIVLGFWKGVLEVMMKMTAWVMRFAPIGVFGLTARAIATSGLDAAGPLLMFVACVIGGLLIYMFIALPLLIRIAGNVSPWLLFPAMMPALLTAFSTCSAAATLPATLECVERAGVSEKTSKFVLPLGISINHAGSALYECAAALFIAQAYGVALSIGTQVTIVLLALVTSMGIASIPAASIVGIVVILNAVGLPPEAVGVLLVVDRLLDMTRTAVNVFADAACAVIVARRQGETSVLQPVTDR